MNATSYLEELWPTPSLQKTSRNNITFLNANSITLVTFENPTGTCAYRKITRVVEIAMAIGAKTEMLSLFVNRLDLVHFQTPAVHGTARLANLPSTHSTKVDGSMSDQTLAQVWPNPALP